MPREMLKRWLSRPPRVTVETARVPDGVRVYVVGDIHGRADLLAALHARIMADAALTPPGVRRLVVYLGDYVDRGLHSREVIDMLISGPLPGFDSVHLRGNHDHEFRAFLDDPHRSAAWLRYGGDATVYSYGVRVPADAPAQDRLFVMRDLLRAAVPPAHVAFLDGLPLVYELGDYLFVHAGVDPEKALDRQSAVDLLWIREEFLEADCDFGKVIVHGHSVSERPDVRENRIGIDTGACFTNVLTALVLQGNSRRIIDTR